MKVSGYIHALAALAFRYLLDRRLDGPQSRSGRYREGKQIARAENRTQTFKPIARPRYLGSPHKRQYNIKFTRMLCWWHNNRCFHSGDWDVTSSSLVGRYTFFRGTYYLHLQERICDAIWKKQYVIHSLYCIFFSSLSSLLKLWRWR
jgi:hypothetical protein